ncbi:MAG: hypothetical protein AAGH65_05460 [Pseudomonadota bacterium]
MKKWLLILGLVFGLALLIVPGLIGAWLPGQIQRTLEQRWPDATPVIERGWWSTSVTAQSSTSRLQLSLTHLPWWRGQWFSGQGRWRLTEPAAEIDLNGQLTFSGSVHLDAVAPQLRWNSVEDNRIESLTLALAVDRGLATQLHVTAQRLVFSDALGNRMVLDDGQLSSAWQRTSEQQRDWTVVLTARRPYQASSAIRLHAAKLDAQGVANAAVSIGELTRAAPNSLQAQMAGLGVLSAWQELVQGGLVLTIQEVALDQLIAFQGRWQPGIPALEMTGGGPIELALDWMTPMIGLNQALPPELARAQAWSLLTQGTDQGLLMLADEQFEWTLGPMTGESSP